MLTDDPKILESRFTDRLMRAPVEDGFCLVASRIGAHLAKREISACRDLIICARAFVFLRRDPAFLARLPDFYACGDDSEIHDLTRPFFTDYPPSRAGLPSIEPQNAQDLVSQPLGVQKSLARTAVRKHHESLLYTPWPPVVQILCENPNVREQDILFMASRRPTRNDLLEPILSSAWSARPEVRFALAANPTLNASHALRCILTLPTTKLEMITSMHGLHPFLSEFSGRVLDFMLRHNRK